MPIVPPPPRKPSLAPLWWALGGLVLLLAIGSTAIVAIWLTGRSAPSTPAGSSARQDVQIAGCGPDATGTFYSARLRVTNSTTRDHDYLITVAFVSGSTRVGTATTAVTHLGPGQTAEETATTVTSRAADSCSVLEVSRL